MNIGDAANRSGVSAKMIRYYERIGLIPTASRTASGYREYEPRDVHMLRFIARARDLGFSVAEITELLDLWRDKDRRSADVKALAQARVRDLRHKIAHLQDMADTLEELANACAGNERPNCPILQRLETLDTDDEPLSRRRPERGFKERIGG
ncbi:MULTISPECIES: Cu(I)-responsive transcriptional regulator [Paracoccus]|jgi:MerR family gold-responsive transcriptional activator of gol and ges genes|uniref:Cu(I)-responsive transcriptional regulator n=1 Tax=Paracoccus haeundaensis TaxID=225362 RepID=A0A5C4RB35_9RHOB|nr:MULTISPECIES: Cu(I)-responsive transcriptional regulator [Paracoccus]MCO6362980.1 Cu(I)-responsive transcriptional regulator [Paracoccus sp. 08]QXI64248.1 HTH-type transcriptional regulator HmrR [Paracoccus marcusii]TNH41145.1 Cu(I)-responsive transcriptional regulator [Paracoccus haeundaensis]